ncbi:MAG: DUF1254 domain-containing protein [Nocardiaceae bacterium]|nr:DUF1254 domain-containing protein [Nocardiaceae bacterium]
MDTFGTRTIDTRIGPLSFDHGMPTTETVATLYDEMDFQRAVQCYLWALPAVGWEGLRQANEQNFGAGYDDIVRLAGYRILSTDLTPNVTTPYDMAFLHLGDHGPMVVDMPAGATAGAVVDWWERPVTDIGLVGPDRGHGGKYLLVGPGQDTPEAPGYHVFRSRTAHVAFFYRVLNPTAADAEVIETTVRIYPYSLRQNPPRTRYLTTAREGDLATMVPPRGLAYWERVAQVLAGEPGEDRDRFFRAMLRPLGLESGKPFQPDGRQQRLLTDATVVGEAMGKALAFHKRFEHSRYRPDARWNYVFSPDFALDQDVDDYTQLDERSALTYEGIGVSAGSIPTAPGTGQSYLGAYVDENGQVLDGAKSYRLHFPSPPPAQRFWALTVYDLDTRCLIQNEQQIAERSSLTGLTTNPDGSVDLYFGPTAPAGLADNWIQTMPGQAWFTYLRLYGPLEPFFDKSWALPDIEANQ